MGGAQTYRRRKHSVKTDNPLAYSQYLAPEDVRAYWQATYNMCLPHTTNKLIDDILKPVCYPHASHYLNRFVHWVQKEAVLWALGKVPIDWKGSRVLDVGCGI